MPQVAVAGVVSWLSKASLYISHVANNTQRGRKREGERESPSRHIHTTPATVARNISNGNCKVIEMLILIDVDNKQRKRKMKGKQQ